MNSSNGEKAAAAGAEFFEPKVTDPDPDPGLEQFDPIEPNPATDAQPADIGLARTDGPDQDEPDSATKLAEFDLNDFDDDFDDDFEAEMPGEYELDDDDYARALLDIVDFEIEGLEAYRDEE